MPHPKSAPARLRAIASRLPDTEQSIACAGTALESATFEANGKAFLFLREGDARLKLSASLAEAKQLAVADPSHVVVGANGWVQLKFADGMAPDARVLERWVAESHELIAAKSQAKPRGTKTTTERSPKGKSKRGKPAASNPMHADTATYHAHLQATDRAICEHLAAEIAKALPEAENKVWHAHPVWFLDGNPIVGYSKLKNCVRLLFWSGQSFGSKGLQPEGSFKAAEARFTAVDQIDRKALRAWLADSRDVQWDYKNIVRRKGRLDRLR